MEEIEERGGENDTYTQAISALQTSRSMLKVASNSSGSPTQNTFMCCQKFARTPPWIDPSTPWIDPRASVGNFWSLDRSMESDGSIHQHLFRQIFAPTSRARPGFVRTRNEVILEPLESSMSLLSNPIDFMFIEFVSWEIWVFFYQWVRFSQSSKLQISFSFVPGLPWTFQSSLRLVSGVPWCTWPLDPWDAFQCALKRTY